MTIKVFKNNKLLMEMKVWDSNVVPNFSYVKGREGWFIKQFDRLIHIEEDEVPTTVLMLHILM